MIHDGWIESECLQALAVCEELGRSWGLPSVVKSFEDLQIPSGAAVALFVADALPEWNLRHPVCAIDVQSALLLSNSVDRVVSWTCHELGHCAVDAFERDQLNLPAVCCGEFEAERLRSEIGRPMTPQKIVGGGLPAWTGHCRNFIRALCHLSWRLRAAGLSVNDCWTFPAGCYSLSPLSWYRDTLACEPELWADRPILAAMQTRAPASFYGLWTADLARIAAAGLQAPRAAKKNVGSSRPSISVCYTSEEPSSEQS